MDSVPVVPASAKLAARISAVERGMLRRTEEPISYLGIDEKSSERGHTYASILTDIDRSRVLDLVPERKLEAAIGLLETLTPTQRLSVKAVAMDMWPAYMSAARQCMPQADIVAALSWPPAAIAGVADRHGRPIAVGEPGAERSDPAYRDVVLDGRLRQALCRAASKRP